MRLLIKNGRVVDPATGTDDALDVLVVNGRVAEVKPRIEPRNVEVVDATRLTVVPGLIDMHVHLREPGYEDKETIASGARAAARGGYTTVCAMPNTDPVNDNRGVTEYILAEARRSAAVNVLPIAAITRGQKGAELTDIADLKAAGAVAFSDDGKPVMNSLIMRRAMEYARPLGALIIDHCEDRSLTEDGIMNEGENSYLFGLRGMPAAAEEIMVLRDIALAEAVGARVHIAHLSARGSIRAVAAARERGLRVTAEATPHHLVLSDGELATYSPDFKMNPPLRSTEDVEALVAAVKMGFVDVIATDHAPHTSEEKDQELDQAPFGIVGLETAVPVLLERLVRPGVLALARLVELCSTNPARLLGLESKGRIEPGADADLTLLDLEREEVIDRAKFESRGRNTPFHGWKCRGTVAMTIVGGRIVYPFDQAGPA